MTDLHVREFEGWKLAVAGFEDPAHRVLDVELARKLGFSRPRKIRELIARLVTAGELPGIHRRPTVGRRELSANIIETTVNEYWLTLEEALFVTAKSDTKTANDVLRAVIKVFLLARDIIDTEVKKRVGYVARLLLADATCEWDLMWPAEFVQALCKLHGIAWDGRVQPRFLGSTYERIYRTLLSDEVYELLKSKNPDPRFGSNHHQWLTPQARDKVRAAIPSITLLAKQVGSKEEFWERFDHEFVGSMLQLDFFTARRGQKKGAA
ncbi:P63c domain [Caudoviricetes sp.]|nr:P63c domain [Caudoviricetes sp.]